jgi:type IV secretion system protein VirB10
MKYRLSLSLVAGAILLSGALGAQEASSGAAQQNGFKRAEEADATPTASAPGRYVVPTGTRILLSMINSVSTKQTGVGDRIYLETAFPILTEGKIVIPQGSWVEGTVTQVKRPGHVKGRGELYVRFDSLTLPNGINRDFRARVGSMDGRSDETLDKNEGKITSAGNKAGDAAKIATTTATGAAIGTAVGAPTGHYGNGAGIGAAAGAAAGLAGVLFSRGPEATLTQGTTMEMVLDRDLTFNDAEIDFRNAAPRGAMATGTGPVNQQSQQHRLGLPY